MKNSISSSNKYIKDEMVVSEFVNNSSYVHQKIIIKKMNLLPKELLSESIIQIRGVICKKHSIGIKGGRPVFDPDDFE